MSNKAISMLGALVVGLGFLAATTNGCGGSGSGGTAGSGGTGSGSAGSTGGVTNAVDACNKVCDKEASCSMLGAITPEQCKGFCTNAGGAAGASGAATTCGGMTAAQVSAKFNACLAMSCDTFLSCTDAICPQTTGTAGVGGTAGSSGTAGFAGGTAGHAGTAGVAGGTAGASGGTAGSSGGTAGTGGGSCAAACAKADACCAALPGGTAAGCNLKMACDGATGADVATIGTECTMFVSQLAGLGAGVPAACK